MTKLDNCPFFYLTPILEMIAVMQTCVSTDIAHKVIVHDSMLYLLDAETWVLILNNKKIFQRHVI
jgi:hypothetical protein